MKSCVSLARPCGSGGDVARAGADRGRSDRSRIRDAAVGVDPLEAIKPGAPVVWPEAPDNIVAAMSYGDAAKVEEVFSKAAHVVSLDLISQRLIPSAMEPRSTIAEIEKKTGRLICMCKRRRRVRPAICSRSPSEAAQGKRPGAGRRYRRRFWPEDQSLSGRRHRGVRRDETGTQDSLRGDRTDEFVGGTHGRDLTSTGEFALDAKGPRAGLSRALGRWHRRLLLRRGANSFRWCSAVRADRRLRSAAVHSK